MVPRLVLALFLSSAGLEAQEVLRPVTVLEGSVTLSPGIPAAGAVVVSDAGGQARTQDDGRFRLELVLSDGRSELHLTAVHTRGSSTRVGHRTIGVHSGGTIPVGELALSTGGCEPAWLPTFGHDDDPPSPIVCVATWDDGNGASVFAGGGNHVARWDGTRWTELPGFFGGTVDQLVVYDDGAGEKLYAGGHFNQFDELFARGLARWDGTAWEVLQPNAGQALVTVYAMEVYDDGLGGGPALYVAGNFELTILGVPVHNVMRYDGTWSAPGSMPDGDQISALVVWDDGLGGGPELYASGIFDVGGTPTIDLARWNGSRWELLASGFTGPGLQGPPQLLVFDDGLGGGPVLCAAGTFTSVGGINALRTARFDGSAWTALGAGIPFSITAFGSFDSGSGPELYIGSQNGRVRRWDGTTWSNPGPLLTDGTVGFLEVVDDGSGPTLWVGQGPTQTLARPLFLSRWDGASWSTLTSFVNGATYALAVYDDGLGGGPALYVGGDFSVAGSQRARCVARWDGAAWSVLGTGISAPMDDEGVRALAVFDDGGGPVLVAGGIFDAAGGTSVSNVAAWDGTSWSALGPGLNGQVSALLVHDDGLGGGPALHAGGSFTASGAVAVQHVARWDGAAWSPLGAGTDAEVLALATHDDGLGGGPALHAGGAFTMAGGAPANGIARWDGVQWTPLGSGVSGANEEVRCLLSFDDGGGPTLWAGGSFAMAGGSPATALARWDGFGWSPLDHLLGSVEALAAFDDGTGAGPALVATGSFTVDGASIHGIARWDGGAWSSLGGSIPVLFMPGFALLVADGGAGVPALYLGGAFSDVGGSDDSNLARWQGCASVPPTLACPDAIEATTFGTLGRVVTFEVTATGAGTPAPVVLCVPPSGSFFPLGTTMVHCTATDAQGNESTCDFPVHVERRVRVR